MTQIRISSEGKRSLAEAVGCNVLDLLASSADTRAGRFIAPRFALLIEDRPALYIFGRVFNVMPGFEVDYVDITQDPGLIGHPQGRSMEWTSISALLGESSGNRIEAVAFEGDRVEIDGSEVWAESAIRIRLATGVLSFETGDLPLWVEARMQRTRGGPESDRGSR